MNRQLQECHRHFVHWLFKDAADGTVLEIGDSAITDDEFCPDLEEIHENAFGIIDGTPNERWVGGAGCCLSDDEMGVIGGIAVCDAINEGRAKLEIVANFDIGGDYAYIQN